jgi:hypothetical protein
MPPLTVPGKSAWIAAAAAALAEDSAWQVPGRPPQPAVTPLMIEHEAPSSLRAWGGTRLAIAAGFALTFILGLGAGALLLGDDPPAPARPVEASAQTGQEVAALAVTRAPPVEVPAQPLPDRQLLPAAQPALPHGAQHVLAMPAAGPPMAVASPPEAMPAEAPPLPLQPAADTAPEIASMPEPASPATAPPPPPFDRPALEAALPMPPPPPRPTARPVRHPEAIDRACREAVFRFQQGATLSATERMHVRNGCATRR